MVLYLIMKAPIKAPTTKTPQTLFKSFDSWDPIETGEEVEGEIVESNPPVTQVIPSVNKPETPTSDVIPVAELRQLPAPVQSSVQSSVTPVTAVDIIPQVKEQQRHLKVYNYWLEQHRSKEFSAGECDERAATYGDISPVTVRLWKAQFNWVPRRDQVLNADRLENQIQVLMKNDKIEVTSLDLIMKYLNQFTSSSLPLDERRVAVFERLVKFAQANKREVSALTEEVTVGATTGVSVTIKH